MMLYNKKSKIRTATGQLLEWSNYVFKNIASYLVLGHSQCIGHIVTTLALCIVTTVAMYYCHRLRKSTSYMLSVRYLLDIQV